MVFLQIFNLIIHNFHIKRLMLSKPMVQNIKQIHSVFIDTKQMKKGSFPNEFLPMIIKKHEN